MVLYLSVCFFRPQVPGAISGSILAEAAHRLVRDTFCIESSPSRLLDHPPYRHKTTNKPRPTGPLGYERGFKEDAKYYHGQHNDTDSSSTVQSNFSNVQANKQNFRVHNRVSHKDHHRNSLTEMSNLTIEDDFQHGLLAQPDMLPKIINAEYSSETRLRGSNYMGQQSRSPPIWTDKHKHKSTANAGSSSNMYQPPFRRIIQPPRSPAIWTNKPMYRKAEVHHTTSSRCYDKQVKTIYKPKTAVPQDPYSSTHQQ